MPAFPPPSAPADNDGYIFSFDTAHPLIKSKENLVRNLMIMPSNPAGGWAVCCHSVRQAPSGTTTPNMVLLRLQEVCCQTCACRHLRHLAYRNCLTSCFDRLQRQHMLVAYGRLAFSLTTVRAALMQSCCSSASCCRTSILSCTEARHL
jgi:hypothetical protein